MENEMVSVLWVFDQSFCVEKYLHKVITALLSLWDIVSGCQDWDRKAVSSAYKARCVCGGRGMSER